MARARPISADAPKAEALIFVVAGVIIFRSRCSSKCAGDHCPQRRKALLRGPCSPVKRGKMHTSLFCRGRVALQ
jgi:hypothetical protein